MMMDAQGHVLITGTGRAGTTLLVRILTAAGLETGFSTKDIAKVDGKLGRAGLETTLTKETAAKLPRIVKSPQASEVICTAVDDGWFDIDLVIVPVRKLEDAVQSRVAVQEKSAATTKHTIKAIGRRFSGKSDVQVSGGLWQADDAASQEAMLSRLFYSLVEGLTTRDIAMTLIAFPRFAKDQDYFISKLGRYFEDRFGLTEAALRQAHASECKLDYITVSSETAATV